MVSSYARGTTGRGAEFAERHGIARTYTSLEQLCADAEVQLVVVALPNTLHTQAITAAVANGKGVICTKPLGRNGTEAADMVRLVRDAGVWSGYAENRSSHRTS